MFDEDDNDPVIPHLVLMYKEIQELVYYHLDKMEEDDIRHALDHYYRYLGYPIFKDMEDFLLGLDSTVVH